MGNLNITGSTIGYNEGGLALLKLQIHKQCILDTNDRLTGYFAALQNEVNKVWVGKSAEAFKTNFGHDVDKLKKTIEQTDMILGAELDNIVKLLKATDAELVKDRSNE